MKKARAMPAVRAQYDEDEGGWQLVTQAEYGVIAKFEDGDYAYIADGMLVMTAVNCDRAVLPLEVLSDLQGFE